MKSWKSNEQTHNSCRQTQHNEQRQLWDIQHQTIQARQQLEVLQLKKQQEINILQHHIQKLDWPIEQDIILQRLRLTKTTI